jgi:hypothetical protein
MIAKGAWGVNLVDVTHKLERGDGVIAFQTHTSEEIFSQVYELGFFLDFCICANMRFRAGYDMLWALDVAESVKQVNFNLLEPDGHLSRQGSIFYGGPSLELQIVF